jgi:sulfur carrier protein
MIEILLNGEPRSLPGEQTIAQLLTDLSLPAQTVAVEVNLELVPRLQHAERNLRPGDQVEIVTFKGGG